MADVQTLSPVAGVASLVIGYLLGSIPFGLLLTRAAGLGDVRTIGSGNIGATNVLRTGNKPIAFATLVCDILKGTAAVLVAGALWGMSAALIAGFGAFLGHLFPAWLRFRGGKGIATYIGVLLGLNWMAAAGYCVVWLITAVATKYSSLAALVASTVTPIGLAIMGAWPLAILTAAMTVLSFLKHRANISRLVRGEESRIGSSR